MKLVIFDIDDTIVNETNFMRDNAELFLKRNYGIDASITNPNGYDLKETYGLVNHFMQLGYGAEEANKKSDKINAAFWNRNFLKYCMQPIKPGVKDTVNVFRDNGYKIYFLSLRGKATNQSTFINNFLRLKVVPFLTTLQLKRGKIVYDELRLVKTNQSKAEFINAMQPDYVFEDQPEVIQQINNGPKIYCIKTPHNEKFVFQNEVFSMAEFDSTKIRMIVEKDHIHSEITKRTSFLDKEVTTNTNLSNKLYIRKVLTEAFYTVMTVIGRLFFFKKYYPIVKGNENIPAKGAIVFIGNHRNKLDPAVVAVSSCRKIHWGALLRMFQGKESLFSLRKNPVSCYVSAAFITAMGAVPIARNTDENYLKINMNSMKMLHQMLAWGGAVGLFPEGTINREPQKQNILPLKSNAIFRLIKDNGGIIETFSIVWLPKELNIKNRVIINYGIPINTRNRSVKEISNTWEEMINCGIEESKKLIDELKKIDRGEADIKERNRKTKDLISQFVNK